MLTNEDYGQVILEFLEDGNKYTLLNEKDLRLFIDSSLLHYDLETQEDVLVSLEILYRMMNSKIEQIRNSISFVSEN